MSKTLSNLHNGAWTWNFLIFETGQKLNKIQVQIVIWSTLTSIPILIELCTVDVQHILFSVATWVGRYDRMY